MTAELQSVDPIATERLLDAVSTELGKKHTLAHIADPDGYRIKLMQAIQET